MRGAGEQRVNEQFDAARASYLASKEAGAVRYVPHEARSGGVRRADVSASSWLIRFVDNVCYLINNGCSLS